MHLFLIIAWTYQLDRAITYKFSGRELPSTSLDMAHGEMPVIS
jgi:hypothetical protein